jgi:hypothetical protein
MLIRGSRRPSQDGIHPARGRRRAPRAPADPPHVRMRAHSPEACSCQPRRGPPRARRDRPPRARRPPPSPAPPARFRARAGPEWRLSGCPCVRRVPPAQRAYRVAAEPSRRPRCRARCRARQPRGQNVLPLYQLGNSRAEGAARGIAPRSIGGRKPDGGTCRRAAERAPFLGGGSPARGVDAHACVVTRTTPRFEFHLSDLRWPARGRVDAPRGGAGASGLPADASSTVSG